MSAIKPVLVQPPVVPHFLTVPEVASLLRLKPRTIYNLVSRRQIPFRKAGRQLLFEAGEIDRWTKTAASR